LDLEPHSEQPYRIPVPVLVKKRRKKEETGQNLMRKTIPVPVPAFSKKKKMKIRRKC